MRVKFFVDNPFEGYNNINPFVEIDKIHDNSAYEIYCDQEILEKIPNENIDYWINKFCSKLRKNGTIIITGIDFFSICHDYHLRSVTEEYISNKIGGSLGFYTTRIIENCLKNNSIKIEKINLLDYNFSIRGVR